MAIEINLSGRKALVTGAGRGIGRAIAVTLAKAGADVSITSRTISDLEETAEIVKSEGVKCNIFTGDASDSESVNKAVSAAYKEMGRIDILCNNAGMGNYRPLLDLSEEDYDRLMDTNMKSMFLFTKAAGKIMIGQNYGRIVNTSSTGGFIAGPNHAVYHASKAANAHFTKAMAIEWARYGITVNAVAPGWIDTEFIGYIKDDEAKFKNYIRAIPMRRLGSPGEVSAAVAFLCSELAGYITGSVFIIDGGLTIP